MLVNTYIIMTMKHYVTNRELFKSYPESVKEIILGAGCFWGVERLFGNFREYGQLMYPTQEEEEIIQLMRKYVWE